MIVGAALAALTTSTAAAVPPTRAGKLVFATGADESDRLEIGLINADGTGMRKLTHNRVGGLAPRWTRNGRKIVFWTVDSFTSRERPWRMNPNGSQISALPDDYPSPNGTRSARLTRRGVDILNVRGKVLRRLRVRLRPNEYFDGPFLWSPNETHVAFGISREFEDDGLTRAFLARVDGRTPPRPLRRAKRDLYEFPLEWSRDGRRLLLGSDSVKVDRTYILDLSTRARRRVNSRFRSMSDWDVTRDLSRVAYLTKQGVIYAAPLRGGAATRLARSREGRRSSSRVAWSPRGDRLAYTDSDGIYVVRARSRPRRIVRIAGAGRTVWSPEGSRLTFSVGSDRIYVVRSDGRRLRLLTRSIWDDAPQFSPDGSRIAFMRGNHGLTDPAALSVMVMNADGSLPRRLGRGYRPRWSPDGTLVAFVDPTADDIVVSAPDGSARRVVARGTAPAWSPDGRQLAFMRYAFQRIDDRSVVAQSRLFVVSVSGGEPRELISMTFTNLQDPAWSPDGRTIVLTSQWDEEYGPGPFGAAFVEVEVPGPPRIVEELSPGEYVWSPDGERLAANASDGIVTIRRDGSDRRVLVSDDRKLEPRGRPAWSPDGSGITFVGCVDPYSDDEVCDVYIVGTDGSGLTRVTRTPGIEGAPDWR